MGIKTTDLSTDPKGGNRQHSTKGGRSRCVNPKGRKKKRASRPKEEESRGEDEEPRRLMNRIKQSL